MRTGGVGGRQPLPQPAPTVDRIMGVILILLGLRTARLG
jgi:hypothetical protein